MLPLTQRLTHSCQTLWTSLTSATWIYLQKVSPTFPANPFQQREELSKRCVNAVFTEHPSVQSNRVQIFSKYCLCLVTKTVSRLQVKVFTGVCNMVMQSSNFDLGFLPIVRTLLASRSSHLQQSQLTFGGLQKLWTFNTRTIINSKKTLQPKIDRNCSPMRRKPWHRYGRLNGNDYIPLSRTSLGQYPYLLDDKTFRNWTVQIDCNISNLRKLYLATSNGISLELRKHK